MKLTKFLLIAGAAMCLASCDGLGGLFGPGDDEKGETNPNLYHLTLTANKTVDQAELKATYASGTSPSQVVVEGTRNEDEIAELLSAGATQADIDKAGVRQGDGSYYFFDNDPMYLEAPRINGYRAPVFYNKSNNNDFYKPGLQGPEGAKKWEFYNMPDKDTVLEARYESVEYSIQWQSAPQGATNYNNPNASRTNYKFETDGEVTLQPATCTNPNLIFVGWEYQDVHQEDEYGYAKWILLEDNKLPTNIDDESLRIGARFEANRYKVEFDFKKLNGGSLNYSDVLDGDMKLNANLVFVDGVNLTSETSSTLFTVDLSKEYKVDCVTGWANFFFTLKSEYKIDHFELNGVRNNNIDASYMEEPYVSIRGADLSQDSVITFVVKDAN